jgi:hypothetical protein
VRMAYPDSPPRQKVFCLGLLSLCQRFPPPWTVEELEACFVVKDSAGQKLAYVYFEDEPGRRSAAKPLRPALARH